MADRLMEDDPSAQLLGELYQAISLRSDQDAQQSLCVNEQLLASPASAPQISIFEEDIVAMQLDGSGEPLEDPFVDDGVTTQGEEQEANCQTALDLDLCESENVQIGCDYEAESCSSSGVSTTESSDQAGENYENTDETVQDEDIDVSDAEVAEIEYDRDEDEDAETADTDPDAFGKDSATEESSERADEPERVDSEVDDAEPMDVEQDSAVESDTDSASEEGSENVDHHEGFVHKSIIDKLTKEQKADKALHTKAKGLIPHLLPPARYWVAILHHNVEPKDARKEKDFLWVKAHKMSTVETIWHTYQNATTEDTFQLMVHNENPEFEDALIELDFYSDKLVVFQAVVKKGVAEDVPIVID